MRHRMTTRPKRKGSPMTANEFEITWALIGKIGAIIALVVSIISGIRYLYELSPSAKLAKRVTSLEEGLKKDYEHLREIDTKIDRLTERVQSTDDELKLLNEGIHRIGKSQILLLRHFVTGNGQKEMMMEADDLTAFFVER